MKKYFLWFLFSIPFLLTGIKICFVNNQYLAETQEKLINNISRGNQFFNFTLSAGIKMFVILTIIFAITTYEVLSNKKNNKNYISSLSRIKNSEGYKFADVWYFLIGIFSQQFPIFVTLFTFGISNVSNGINDSIEIKFINLYSGFLPNLNSEISSAFLMIFVILIIDLMNYVKHRMEHKIPFLWDFHELHHSSTEMTILCKYRGLPLIDIFTSTFLIPISVFSGILLNQTFNAGFKLPLIIYATYVVLNNFADFIGHSSMKITYPKPISYLLMSPSNHLIHHSAKKEHFDKNFGQFLAIWDIIFNSYLGEEHIKNIEKFGVPNTQYNKYHPIYCVTIMPLVKLSRRMRNKNLL